MPLFKQLRPEEIKPLLDKAYAGRPLSPRELGKLDGTLIAPHHRKNNDFPEQQHYFLSFLHDESFLDERLAAAEKILGKNPNKMDFQSLHEDISRLSDALKSVRARLALARWWASGQPGLAKAISDEELGMMAVDKAALEQARKEHGTPVREFIDFSKLEELHELHAALLRFDEAAIAKARGVEPRRFFEELLSRPNADDLLRHSRLLDHVLGIHFDAVADRDAAERVKTDRREQLAYDPTPYVFIRKMLDGLKLGPKDVLYDLGSGYGRVALFSALASKAGRIRGVELVPQRVKVAEAAKARIGGLEQRVRFVAGHAAKQRFPEGAAFFMFNPFSRETLDEVLEKLSKLRRFRLVAYGPAVGKLNALPWLRKTMAIHGASEYEWVTFYEKAGPTVTKTGPAVRKAGREN